MAHRIADRVLETTTSTGTGNITMAGAVTGYSTVDSACTVDGDTIDLVIGGGTQWEYVRFTRVSAGVYSRAATPWGSSSGGSAITFIAGVKEVWSDVGAFFAEHLNTVEIAIASAATCDIGALRGLRAEITGTTTITSFGTAKNKLRFLRFSGALTLTHNGTSLILPGATNIVTAAGDTAVFASDSSSGNWRCLSYTRGIGPEVVSSTVTFGAPTTGYVTATAKNVTSISLTPGEWDVFGSVINVPAGATVTTFWEAGISIVSNTLPALELMAFNSLQLPAGQSYGAAVPSIRVSLSATTTIYLVALMSFTTSTMSVAGVLTARRVR